MRKTPEEIRDLLERSAKGQSIAVVADALFPVLTELKDELFLELAYAAPDPYVLARISGKAQLLDRLEKALHGRLEDGRAAVDELQTGGRN